jgi:hypothetical protein
MKKLTLRLGATLLATCIASFIPILASVGHTQEDVEPSQYRVELVIFRHLDKSDTTQEKPREATVLPIANIEGVGDAPSPTDTMQLNNIAQRINDLQAYELVRQLAWIQTAENIEAAEPVNLALMDLDPDVVSGTVKFFTRQPFLHLDIDLLLHNSGADISGSKRIRLNESHYFDHPDFGVIAKVSRAECCD